MSPAADSSRTVASLTVHAACGLALAPPPRLGRPPGESAAMSAVRVFVSSTYLDNVERRRRVEEAILHAEMVPVGMERFVPGAAPTVDECRAWRVGVAVSTFPWHSTRQRSRVAPLPALCYCRRMSATLTVRLDDGLAAALAEESRRTSRPKGRIVSEALAEHLRRKRPSAVEALRRYVGCVDGPPDLSTNRSYLASIGKPRRS